MQDQEEHRKEAAVAFGILGVFLLATAAAWLQWATPILAHTLAVIEQHSKLLIGIAVAIVLLYIYVRIELVRLRGRGRGPRVSSPSQPVYDFHPGRDRPGILGALGRRLMERRGGPVISDGRSIRVLDPDEEDVDEDDEDDEEEEPAEQQHRYTAAEAKRIYQAAVADRRNRRKRW